MKEPVTNNGKRPEAATNDQAAASGQAVDDNDWFEKALEDRKSVV